MRLSLQQKEQFFHEMQELLRSGQTIQQALELKSHARSAAVREIASAMLEAIQSGGVEKWIRAVPGVFSEMDGEIVRGGESSGRMADALGYLSDYYGAMARMRRKILAKAAYPVFLLHFGALMFAIPSLVARGFGDFLAQLMIFLGVFYAVAAVGWMLFGMVAKIVRTNPSADQMMQSLPAIGGTRIALIGSRFCMVMGILVQASGGILSAMTRAASASGSALFERGAEAAVAEVQGGGTLGRAVAQTQAFPEAIDQAFRVGEASGRLDEEMHRQAGRYTAQFQDRLDYLSFWLPKLLLIAISVILAVKIIQFWAGYYANLSALIP